VRARVSDPIGPFWWRWLPTGVSVLVMALAVALSMDAGSFKGALLAIGAMLFFLAPMFLPRLGAREATLELGSGVVRVKDAGIASQTIRTRDVVAASTARTREGIALALVRKGREGRPLVLDLQSEDDARRVRDALGIGHFGFGSLEWPTKRGTALGFTIFARVAAAISCALMAGGTAQDGLLVLGLLAAYFSFPAALIMMLVTLFTSGRNSPTVALRPEGVAVSSDGRRYQTIPYTHIANARHDALGLHLKLHGGASVDIEAPETVLTRTSMSEGELAHLTAQILSAAQRAQGAGPQAPALPERVADLAQRRDAGRSWLARLDAVARLLTSGAGYRGVGFEESDLWTTLEDHDAPADLRAGAARVLVRVDKSALPRIEEVLARVRDDGARARMRVAVEEDIDAAGEEIDRLDVREGRRQRVA